MTDKTRPTIVTCLITTALLGGYAVAEPMKFDFKDPKGVNSMSFVLDSILEPIMGLANDISGTVTFDPENPGDIKGKITIAAKSLATASDRMTKVLHSADWLDVEKFPTIELEFKGNASKTKSAKGIATSMVTGQLTCHGVTKEITIPLRMAHLPDRAGDRMRGAKGDLLVLRATLRISRKEFGIKPDMGPETVADRIEIRVSIVGMHKK